MAAGQFCPASNAASVLAPSALFGSISDISTRIRSGGISDGKGSREKRSATAAPRAMRTQKKNAEALKIKTSAFFILYFDI
jgi:hypothetical protein